MNKSTWIVPATLVVGVLLGGYLAAPAGGQIAQAPGYQFPVESLPPHPSQIVNLDGAPDILFSSVGHNVYTVPNDHWLVVTDVMCRSSKMFPRLIERFGGVDTTVISEHFLDGYPTDLTTRFTNDHGRHSAVGWAFRPGSTVVIRMISATGSSTVPYNITGYLIRR